MEHSNSLITKIWNPKLNIGSGDASGVKLYYDGNTGEKLTND